MVTPYPKDPVDPGSDEWTAAVQEFERDNGCHPSALVGEDGWCVSRFPEGPGVAWTEAGVRALRQQTLDTPGAFAFWGGLLNQLNRQKDQAGMTAPYTEDAPRDSADVRRDVDAWRSALTEAARSGDRDDYTDALAGLRAAEAELKESELREFNDLAEGFNRGTAA